MERAYGVEALSTNYALASVHVLFCYIVGITCMETVHANGNNVNEIIRSVIKAIFKNTLALGTLALLSILVVLPFQKHLMLHFK